MRARAAVAAAAQRAGLDPQVAQAVVGQPYDGDVLALGPAARRRAASARTTDPPYPGTSSTGPGWSCGTRRARTRRASRAAAVRCRTRVTRATSDGRAQQPATARTSRRRAGAMRGQHRPSLPHGGSGRRSLAVARDGARSPWSRPSSCAVTDAVPSGLGPSVRAPSHGRHRRTCPDGVRTGRHPVVPPADWFLDATERGNPWTPWTPGTRTGVPGPAATGCARWCTAPTTSPSCWRAEAAGAGDLVMFAGLADGRRPASRPGGGHRRSPRCWRGRPGAGWTSAGCSGARSPRRCGSRPSRTRSRHGRSSRPAGQCLLDMRVRPNGSHHQKFFVLRHRGRPELGTSRSSAGSTCAAAAATTARTPATRRRR